MSVSMVQKVTYTGDHRWDWSVWIDGPEAELDEIESVEYVLHPTFPQPVRVTTERDTKFRLDSAGWAEFEINAHLKIKDGRQQPLKHWLQLGDSSESSSEPGREAGGSPAVFLSAGIADSEWEEALREAFKQRGCIVLAASDLPAGVTWESAISSAIDQVDLVVGIFSEKSSSTIPREILKALDKEVSIVPVVVGPRGEVPTRLQGVNAIHVEDLRDVPSAVGTIVDTITL